MSFPSDCPRCRSSLVGAEIHLKKQTTWPEINEMLIRSGMVMGHIPAPPGHDLFYAVIAACPRCNARLSDFLIADSSVPSQAIVYHAKSEKYESSKVLTPEMLTPPGSDVRISAKEQATEL